jgi:hypothetical protein
MATLSFEHAARLTGQGTAILARAISGRLFLGTKENGGCKIDGAEVGPTPVETRAELRSRLALAEERLIELKAMLEDMRRDRDAWREQAQTRLLAPPATAAPWWRWVRRAA